MLLGNGFLPMFAVASGGGLVGATWALDGSGRAYSMPTLGSELVVNGDFSSAAGWSTTWTISSGVASTSGNSRSLQRPIGATVGAWYQIAFDVLSYTTGFWYLSAAGFQGLSVTLPNTVANTLTRVVRATSTADLRFISDGSAGWTGTIDNVSTKAITLPTTLATITGSSTNLTAAARIHTLTTGTQAGVVSLLDSASNPQNFLLAYHDGTNVRLDKCVAGVYTNLITTAVAFTGGAQIEIRRPSGNTFQLWYGGSQCGTNQTVNDASIISNTIYGLFSTFSGNLFSEFSLGGAVIPFGF